MVNILLLYEDFICTPFYSVFCSLTSSCITWNRALPGGLILSMSILGQQALIIFMCIIRFKWNTGGGSNTIAYLYIIYPIHTYHSILLVYDICIYIYIHVNLSLTSGYPAVCGRAVFRYRLRGEVTVSFGYEKYQGNGIREPESVRNWLSRESQATHSRVIPLGIVLTLVITTVLYCCTLLRTLPRRQRRPFLGNSYHSGAVIFQCFRKNMTNIDIIYHLVI